MGIKSLRLDDELASKIEKDANFSGLANKAIEEYLNKSVWIPNYHIEKHAGISAKKMHDRIENVKYLRCGNSALTFTLYPGSDKEIQINKNLHAYARGDYNLIHDSYIYFNIKFPLRFFLFLKSRDWEEVERMIRGFLSALFWSEPEKRSLMEDQLERRPMKAVIKIVQKDIFKVVESAYKDWRKDSDPIKRAKYNNAYFQLLIALGLDPLIFPYISQILGDLHYPFHFNNSIPSENGGFDIKFSAGYMRDIYDETDDWQSIVVHGKNKTDDLQRAESNSEPWKNWLDAYEFFHYKELKGSIHAMK